MSSEVLDFMGVFDYKTDKHVSWMYTALGMLAFMGIAITVGSGSFIPAVFIVAIAAVIFSMNKGVLINPSAKSYRMYTSILGMKTGKDVQYSEVEYLYITRRGMSHTMSASSMQATASYMEFLGSIRFSEKEKIVLLVRDNKEIVRKELEKLGSALHVNVVDYTEEEE